MEDEFRYELRNLLNKHSKDADCDTADGILADYVIRELESLQVLVDQRRRWYQPPEGQASAGENNHED